MITSDGTMMKMYYTRRGKAATLDKLIKASFPEKDPKNPSIRIVAHTDFHKFKTGGLDLLLVECPVERMEDIDNFIGMIEADVLQVEINVRVVEVTRTNNDQRGFNFGVKEVNPENTSTPFNQATGAYNTAGFLKSLSPGGEQVGPLAYQGARLLLDTIQQDYQIDIAIELLSRFQEVEVLSAPTIRVLNGHPAMIKTGERTPIQTATFNKSGLNTVSTTFQDTGVTLNVTPTVVAQDTVRLEIVPEVSSVTSFSDPATSGGVAVPFISQRRAETVVNVKNGEIFLLGGLYYTTELNQKSKIPLLGDIPLLGFFFSSSNKVFTTSEILFFIQPKIITPRSGARGRLILPPDELK